MSSKALSFAESIYLYVCSVSRLLSLRDYHQTSCCRPPLLETLMSLRVSRYEVDTQTLQAFSVPGRIPKKELGIRHCDIVGACRKGGGGGETLYFSRSYLFRSPS